MHDGIRTEDRLVREFKVSEFQTNCKVTIFFFFGEELQSNY